MALKKLRKGGDLYAVKHNSDSGTHHDYVGKIDVYSEESTGAVLPDPKSFAEAVGDYEARRRKEAAEAKAQVGWTPKLAANWPKGLGPKKKKGGNPENN